MKKYLVIGNPIDHSLSPKLHNYWIKKNNIDAIYEKKQVNEEDIRDFLYEKNVANDHEIESTINKIRKELDQNQQKLIKMSFFEQKSHKKIAEELEIPLGTVKSRIRASLNKMQKYL